MTSTPLPVPPAEARAWLWPFLASLAVASPTLVAYNLAPSATFFNQAAAFVGWGAFLLVVGAHVPRTMRPRSSGSLALLAALAIVFLAALAASLWAAVPWPLSLSSAGTILAAIFVVAMGACAERSGIGTEAFRAFCIALVVAGIAASAIGLVQVFAPDWPDGDWIAVSAIPGRATSNLRQPNHLSSLLLWSIVGVVWLGEASLAWRKGMTALALVFMYVVVLSASRTGALGMLTLAGWGLFDRRLSRQARWLLLLAPVAYGAMWWGTSVWATHSHHLFGGQTRFGGGGDISSSRFAIWSNTLSLIAMHPWLGVGFGDFNFAWTLTPFPHRPVAFFDHTHNIVLNFMVELGIPLALVVTGLLSYALVESLRNAIDAGRPAPVDVAGPGGGNGSGSSRGNGGRDAPTVQRAAFVIVFMVAVHSMLEYPLWYSYFLLPAAFAFGLGLERRAASSFDPPRGDVTRPYVLAAMALMLCGALALYDYLRVVVIFAPPAGAGPLEGRIADGRRSVLFAHHADYAAGTVAEHPGHVASAFKRAPHYLLDARLMVAWAKALAENGETDKARYVAARLREFRNDQAEDFFAPCEPRIARAPAAAASASASAPAVLPFQCEAPRREYRYEDFR